MKLKKKEDQNVDASVLLRGGNKIITGGNMEKKSAETERKANRRLPHLGNLSHIQSSNPDTIVDAKK
jgi:CelD/BcsL family acetyltransferase involved in cellulose biosynthesis